jgi:hypothetical protein
MKGAPETPHSRHPHVYAIVRFDPEMSLENCATVVKVVFSRQLAEQEAARLNELNKAKNCKYVVQTTRFTGSLNGLTAES